ncbi:hypothetical protein [Anabaena azotica]|uniref:Uncharacterized protein n=1 Tax=Anabaena azotica FACHB-119 TaxID=947527 RepID=A0ABR8D0C6_9NOST|nr:hypothetical protein [Anabaena azotica]MBD2499843.1 hypothetical protein [Anabaena azotica FACHB-119]
MNNPVIKCQHPDCKSTNVTECFYPTESGREEKAYYCTDHTPLHGFCRLCGQFWTGVEYFEFAILHDGMGGVCENCEAELREDLDDYEEDDYFTDYL